MSSAGLERFPKRVVYNSSAMCVGTTAAAINCVIEALWTVQHKKWTRSATCIEAFLLHGLVLT